MLLEPCGIASPWLSLAINLLQKNILFGKSRYLLQNDRVPFLRSRDSADQLVPKSGILRHGRCAHPQKPSLPHPAALAERGGRRRDGGFARDTRRRGDTDACKGQRRKGRCGMEADRDQQQHGGGRHFGERASGHLRGLYGPS